MTGHVFVIQGDLSQLQGDVLVYTTDSYLQPGQMRHAFERRFPDFTRWIHGTDLLQAAPEEGHYPVGQTFRYLLSPKVPPRLLSVVVTDDGPDAAGQTQTAARRAIAEAVAWLEEAAALSGERRPLIALPAINLGVGADPAAQNRLATVVLGEALDFLQETDAACDVAFVT
jgi:hypothetical protein